MVSGLSATRTVCPMNVLPHVWTFRAMGDSPIDVSPHGGGACPWGEIPMGKSSMGQNV